MIPMFDIKEQVMARTHTHKIFGQEHAHPVTFRHTNNEDRNAHKNEVEIYKSLRRRKQSRESPRDFFSKEL